MLCRIKQSQSHVFRGQRRLNNAIYLGPVRCHDCKHKNVVPALWQANTAYHSCTQQGDNYNKSCIIKILNICFTMIGKKKKIGCSIMLAWWFLLTLCSLAWQKFPIWRCDWIVFEYQLGQRSSVHGTLDRFHICCAFYEKCTGGENVKLFCKKKWNHKCSFCCFSNDSTAPVQAHWQNIRTDIRSRYKALLKFDMNCKTIKLHWFYYVMVSMTMYFLSKEMFLAGKDPIIDA